MNNIRLLVLCSLLVVSEQSLGFCDRWNWNIQLGLAPTVWINREDFTAVSCNATSVLDLPNAVIPLFKFPQFNQLFHVPWIIGTYFTYETDCGLHLFAQFDYRRAKGRNFTIPRLVIPDIDTIVFSIIPQDHYQAIDVFAGIQYEYPLQCIDASGFLGGKVGLVHRASVDTTFVTNSLTVPFENETESRRLLQRNTVPAVGAMVGVSGYIGDCFLWCLQIELVAACGPHINKNIFFDFATESVFINPLLAPNNFINNGVQTEIYFPITFGFKYLL